MSQVHNEISRATDILRGLKLAVGLDKGEAGIERLGETLTPILNVYELAEWAFLRGEWLGVGRLALGAGGAGVRSLIQLKNPATSKRLVTVHGASAGSATTAITPTLFRFDTDLTTLGTTIQPRDTRLPTSALLTQVRSQNVALPGAAVNIGRLIMEVLEAAAAHAHWPREWPLVIAPGHGFMIGPEADNQGISAMWVFSERELLPGELGS